MSANGRCKAVTVAKDATTTVRLGNFQRIKIQVNKTLDQLRVPAGKTFQFSIRKDTSTNPADANGGSGSGGHAQCGHRSGQHHHQHRMGSGGR